MILRPSSKGRHGYGTQYKLVVSPEMVGITAFPEWWKGLVEAKIKHDQNVEHQKSIKPKKSSIAYNLYKTLELDTQKDWQEFVGSNARGDLNEVDEAGRSPRL